jgi:hypothetical protein
MMEIGFRVISDIKFKKSLKIQKWKDFNGNGYLQEVRHAAPYGDHFGLLCVAILNPKRPPKYKYPPIWTKFGFQVDYDVANWYQSLVCYVGHFVSGLRFQWKSISRSIMKWGIGWCPEFWYEGRLWTSVFASKHNQT